jgi:hypothetical protein
MNKEEWKTIKEYKGRYEVSSLGRVRNRKTSRILKQFPTIWGYLNVFFYDGGIRFSDRVHRLVAKEFIPNPQDKRCVHHKDFNKMNCGASNLEWCTDKENVNYSASAKHYSHSHPSLWVSVRQFNKDGDLLHVFSSITEASKESKIRGTAIVNNLTGLSNSSGGYIWRYN